MTMQHADPQNGASSASTLLFSPGRRLGWTFRDRRELVSPYSGPGPDLQRISAKIAARRAWARRASRFLLRRVAAPCLTLALLLYMLTVFIHGTDPHVRTASLGNFTVSLGFIGAVCVAGCLAWLVLTAVASPERSYQAALRRRGQRADWHHRAELARLADVPEWASAAAPAGRVDIYGGSLASWRSLLTVYGASLLAERPLLVADFTRQLASDDLTALAQKHGSPAAVYLLPADLDRCGVLDGITPRQLATALTEAIHAKDPGPARERAVDMRVLEKVATALGEHLTPARLSVAIQAALGQPVPPGQLTAAEAEWIRGDLFRDDYRAQITPSLVRLDAFVADLASYAGSGPPQPPVPTWYTCLALEPGPPSARTETLAALTIGWLTTQITQSTATAPAVIIAGADDITPHHLEALAAACEQRGVPLTLLFQHLREGATATIGGAATTAFMRLGNHHEAEQAAAFIGRDYKFVVSGWTVTRGDEYTTSHTITDTHGTTKSNGKSRTRGNLGSLFGRDTSRTRSREHGTNDSRSYSDTQSRGASSSSGVNTQRVYEFTVEPTDLQKLPDNTLLLPANHGIVSVECNPQIITLPGAAGTTLAPETATPPALTSRPGILRSALGRFTAWPHARQDTQPAGLVPRDDLQQPADNGAPD